MWGIDYKDHKRLHMSIGLGLIVAAFILFISTTWIATDHYYNIVDWLDTNHTIEADQVMIESIKTIASNVDSHFKISIWVLFLGVGIFATGYIPYMLEEFKKK